MSATEKLQQIEKNIKTVNGLTIQAETRLEGFRNQYKEVEQDLLRYNVDATNGRADLEARGAVLMAKIEELSLLVSPNAVKELQAELEKPIEIEVNLPDSSQLF